MNYWFELVGKIDAKGLFTYVGKLGKLSVIFPFEQARHLLTQAERI